MKKMLFTMLLMMTLTAVHGSAAHNQRQQTEATELTDSTSKNTIEAFSDTTSTAVADTSAVADGSYDRPQSTLDRLVGAVDMEGLTGMLFVLFVLLIIFVLSPVLIIVALFYFIHKSRRDKLQLAQMAVQNGQSIPEQLLADAVNPTSETYQKGVRQCCVGVGLMFLLGYAIGHVGFGIGALVFCIGLGKVFTSKGLPFGNKSGREPDDNLRDAPDLNR